MRRAHNSKEIQDEVKAKINEFAGRGFRALGLAVAEGDTGDAKCAPVLARLSHVQGTC